MKKLLVKSFRANALFAFLTLAASIPVYFYLVESIWISEIDEQNEIVALRFEERLKAQCWSSTSLLKDLEKWNNLYPGIQLLAYDHKNLDYLGKYEIVKQNPYLKNNEIDRYRGFRKLIMLNNTHFVLQVEVDMEEGDEIVSSLAAVAVFFILVLLIGFLFIARYQSKRLWRPFWHTLNQLKRFNLNKQEIVSFEATNIEEFTQLNAALNELLNESTRIYNAQKEFTENASHELQTPLATAKSKLELLQQSAQLNEVQFQLIEETMTALQRTAKLNKNLLLLTKLENKQFLLQEKVHLGACVHNVVNQFDLFIGAKNLQVQVKLFDNPVVIGSNYLIELLVTNLVSNSIKFAPEQSTITAIIDKNKIQIRNTGTEALMEEKLFQRFQKQQNNSEGTGLGLAICKEICAVMGWKLSYSFKANEHIFTIHY